jgi:hypothetical protein
MHICNYCGLRCKSYVTLDGHRKYCPKDGSNQYKDMTIEELQKVYEDVH